MRSEFKPESGSVSVEDVHALAEDFSALLDKLDKKLPTSCRERSLVVTKLQEAHDWAIRALLLAPR